MKMDPIDSFDVPALGFKLVDFQHAGLENRREALRIIREMLQEIIRDARPAMDGLPPECNAAPELGSKNFIVYADGEVMGTFNIYNVFPSGNRFIASAAPGVLAAEGRSVGETWGLIMSAMLEEFVDAWIFPSETDHAWQGAEVPDEAIAELIAAGHEVTLRSDGTPERIDRAG